MNDVICPRFDALSALVDDALPPAARRATLAHVEHCPVCAGALAELRALGAHFAALPPERLGYDLGAVIEARLAGVPRAAPAPAPGRGLHDRWRRWLAGLAVPAFGGAAALVVGLYLGAHLFVPGDAAPPRVAMMAVFGTMPPGTICAAYAPCPSGNAFE